MKKSIICSIIFCTALNFSFAQEIIQQDKTSVEQKTDESVQEAQTQPGNTAEQAASDNVKQQPEKESDSYDDGTQSSKTADTKAKKAKNTPEKASDSYDDGTQQNAVQAEKELTPEELAEQERKERIKREKSFGSSGNWGKDFFFGKEKYIRYGSVELNTGTIIGIDIKPRVSEMIFDPKTDMAGVATYFQTNYYDILWDGKTRMKIRDSFNQYLKDFESKKLIRNNYLKTRRMYLKNGSGMVRFGTVKIMMDAVAKPVVECGYEFKNKSPYFCIIMKPAKNIAENTGSNKADSSVEVQLYFTKAQAKEFLDYLSDESIEKQRQAYLDFINGNTSSTTPDEY